MEHYGLTYVTGSPALMSSDPNRHAHRHGPGVAVERKVLLSSIPQDVERRVTMRRLKMPTLARAMPSNSRDDEGSGTACTEMVPVL